MTSQTTPAARDPEVADAGIRTYPTLFRNAVLVRGGEAHAPADVDARRNDSIRSTG
jgi:hypothetical protein